MSVRYYCDICEREAIERLKRNYVSDRAKIEKDNVIIEVSIAVDGTWNSGFVCKDCLERVFNDGVWHKGQWE